MPRIGNVDYQPRMLKLNVKSGEGKFTVTVDGIPGKAWEGESEQAAIIAAKKGSSRLFEERAQTTVPKWIQEETDRAEAARADYAKAYVNSDGLE